MVLKIWQNLTKKWRSNISRIYTWKTKKIPKFFQFICQKIVQEKKNTGGTLSVFPRHSFFTFTKLTTNFFGSTIKLFFKNDSPYWLSLVDWLQILIFYKFPNCNSDKQWCSALTRDSTQYKARPSWIPRPCSLTLLFSSGGPGKREDGQSCPNSILKGQLQHIFFWTII
jgi:hypothetical protein